KSALSPVRMLPITFALSGSSNQTRPPGPPASGLGSRTYSQPGAGRFHVSTSMLECSDASVDPALISPAAAPDWPGGAAKTGAKDTERKQIKGGRKFAFMRCPFIRCPRERDLEV